LVEESTSGSTRRKEMTNDTNQEHEEVLNFAHSLPSGLTKEQIYVRIHERAKATAAPASQAAAPAADLVPKWAGEFTSHRDWVNRAQRALYVPDHMPRAICVDAKGRRCHIGKDMARARDEDAFPVRYFWECEVLAGASPVPAAIPEGWTANTGTQPVGDDVLVDVLLRSGYVDCDPARRWKWEAGSRDSDIIAYRVVAAAAPGEAQ
jgi:hypothetical protein